MNKQALDKLNVQIEKARKAVGKAEFAGVRGEAMLALKAELRRLKAQHKAARA